MFEEMQAFRAASEEIAKDPQGNAVALIGKMETGTELDLTSPLGDRMVIRRLDAHYSVRYDGKVYVGDQANAIKALTMFFEEGAKTLAALKDVMEKLAASMKEAGIPPLFTDAAKSDLPN